MRETIHDTTTDRPSERLPAATRRGVLAAALAGALLPAATDAGAAPSNGADSELLAAIAEFDELERWQRALYDGGIDYDDEWLKRVTQPARDRQRVLLRTICHLRATRPETHLARARSFALYEQQYAEPDPDGYVDQALRNALLRDLREGRA
jgi:hypothetical protein